MEKETKQCPYCGEEILAIAKKCRYCGEWLTNDISPMVQPQFSPTSVAVAPAVNTDNAFRRSTFCNCLIGGIKRSFKFKGTATRKELLFLLLYALLAAAFFVGCMFLSLDPDSVYDFFFDSDAIINHGLVTFFMIVAIVVGSYMLIPIMACCCRRAHAVGMKGWRGIVWLPITILIIWVIVRDEFDLIFYIGWNLKKMYTYVLLVTMLFGIVLYSIIPFIQMMKRVEVDDKDVAKFNYIDIIYIAMVIGLVVWGVINYTDWLYEADQATQDLNRLMKALGV